MTMATLNAAAYKKKQKDSKTYKAKGRGPSVQTCTGYADNVVTLCCL